MSRIIVFGDSISYGKWDSKGGYVARLREYIDTNYNLPKGTNHQVYNLGIPGQTTRRLLEHFEIELEKRLNLPEDTLLIFQVGLNDANHNNSFHKEKIPFYEFRDNMEEIIEISRKYTDKILFISITQIHEENLWKAFPLFKDKFFSTEVDTFYRLQLEILKELQVSHLDLYKKLDPIDFSDGIHPGDSDHEKIFREVLEYAKNNISFK